MTIEMANRLTALRKEHSLSQEQLAEKIGVSRQAVSKWERAEASPDIENLSALAKLYGVTIDVLVNGEEETETVSDTEEPESGFDGNSYTDDGGNAADGFDRRHSIHIEDGDDVVHVGFDGIYVGGKHGEHVSIGKDGVYVSDSVKEERHWKPSDRMSVGASIAADFPMFIVVLGAYLLTGFLCDAWAVNWLLFLIIPVYDTIISAVKQKRPSVVVFPVCIITAYLCAGLASGLWHPLWIMLLAIPCCEGLITAIRRRNANHFPYPVLVSAAYLVMGFGYDLWHPGWIVFFSIPIYYWIVSSVKKVMRK
ncbi:MAG: helix-turn-helix transcriptional regulator [Eubacterium sp.]|nr:helix-turn-helix transcriptional regulator [Eubacterium sp.]